MSSPWPLVHCWLGAALGFFVDPLGDVPAIAKYAHNVTFLAGALVLSLCAGRAGRQRAVNYHQRGVLTGCRRRPRGPGQR
jgi:hypothetical protein